MAISEKDLFQQVDIGRSALPERDLVDALDEVRQRLLVIEARLEQMEQEAVKARKEEHLLETLLALRRGEETPPSKASELTSTPRSVATANGGARQKADAVEATVALLRRSGRPMHIGEIMKALRDQGVQPPGQGTQANLISHLRRDTRVARPSRGMYGLVELGVKDYKPATRKRRGKGRKSAKKIAS